MDQASPRIGLALGGGGARGLAHISVLEAFDDLGVRPTHIAGTSIGALIGAIYASGLSAAEIREHARELLANRRELIRRILADPAVTFGQLLSLRPRLGAMIDGELLVRAALPDGLPDRIEDLPTRFTAVATDFYRRTAHPLTQGPVVPAIAASIALPGLIAPRRIQGRVLIDGGVTDPLPFRQLDEVDIVIAVDVTGRPVGRPGRMPALPELVFRSSMIMQHLLVQANIERSPPDILIRPDVDHIRVLEFLKLPEIEKAAAAAREELKRRLADLLAAPPGR